MATFPTRLIRHLVRADPTFRGGLYKLFNGLTWEEKRLPRLTYDDIGYKAAKEKQLFRNYVNEDEFERVESILKRRARGKGHHMTSVALAFRGRQKSRKSQGWCLLSMVISRMRRPALETVELHYRSTEAIFKFGGDLCLMNWIFNRFNLNPDLVRWRFANIHLSGIYLPVLFQFWEPLDFLQFVHDNDMDFFKRGTRWLLRAAYKPPESISKDGQFFPYSPENIQHRILWERCDPAAIVNFLEPLYLKYGYDLPKLFHQRSTYVTRQKKRDDEEDE